MHVSAYPLPIRRKRRPRWPVILAVLVAFSAVGMVIHAARKRQRVPALETTPVPKSKAASLPPKASMNDLKTTPGAEPSASLSKLMPGKATEAPRPPPHPAPPEKPKPAVRQIPQFKAMPAGEVRKEFERAAGVLRQYFQSPGDDKIKALLRHPEETLPRHREWTRTHQIVPVMPLQIGPQFGTSGSLLITGIKLNDGSLRMAALEKTDQGYLLDWESFAGWSERRFAELSSVPSGQGALMRVSIRPSSATPPATAPGGATFTLTHPDERSTLAAYATAATLQGNSAARKLQQAGGGMFTLRLTVDEEDARNGRARIHEVLCSGWLPDLNEKQAIVEE